MSAKLSLAQITIAVSKLMLMVKFGKKMEVEISVRYANELVTPSSTIYSSRGISVKQQKSLTAFF